YINQPASTNHPKTPETSQSQNKSGPIINKTKICTDHGKTPKLIQTSPTTRPSRYRPAGSRNVILQKGALEGAL
ncbi:hypothetical protein, partial [Pseudovibrio japonicus]|uniref:hypothetical protein n=1 Tax=Pseudovibrio japonicus TaxID=366534 RepID=UPI001AD8C01F